jgi:hypothetical protein
MKSIYSYLLLILSLTLAQCQDIKNKANQIAQKQLDDCKQYDYCFKDSLMFYKGKQFELYGKIEDYVRVFGKYDRKVQTYSSPEAKVSYYYFKNKKTGSIGENSLEILIENEDGERVEELKNLKVAILKYGAYDSVRLKKIPASSVKHYVWDKAGLSAFSTNDTIHDLNLKFSKGNFDEFGQSKEERDKSIWTPYSGKICFDGNIIAVGSLSTENWNTSIKKMGLSGDEFDPEGNEGSVMRKVIRYYKNRTIRFDFMRQIQSETTKDRLQSITIAYMKD